MKCKFCERRAHARGLCGTHYGYARRKEAGLTPDDMDPRKCCPTTNTPLLTDAQAYQMVRLFASEFTKLRKEQNFSVTGLTTKTGLSRKTINRIENEGLNMKMSTLLATLGSIPFGPQLLHNLASKLEQLQANAKT